MRNVWWSRNLAYSLLIVNACHTFSLYRIHSMRPHCKTHKIDSWLCLPSSPAICLLHACKFEWKLKLESWFKKAETFNIQRRQKTDVKKFKGGARTAARQKTQLLAFFPFAQYYLSVWIFLPSSHHHLHPCPPSLAFIRLNFTPHHIHTYTHPVSADAKTQHCWNQQILNSPHFSLKSIEILPGKSRDGAALKWVEMSKEKEKKFFKKKRELWNEIPTRHDCSASAACLLCFSCHGDIRRVTLRRTQMAEHVSVIIFPFSCSAFATVVCERERELGG